MPHKKNLIVLLLAIFVIYATFSGNPGRISAQSESPLTSALKGNVLWLGGNTQYADAPFNSSLELGTGQYDDFTIECFFYVPTLDNKSFDALIYQPSVYQLYFNFQNTTNDYIIYKVNTNPASTVDILYPTNLSVGWHHIAIEFDNEHTSNWDRRALYLDGTLAAEAETTEWTPGLWTGSSPLLIGFNSSNTFDGYIEELRISDIVRYDGAGYAIPGSPFTKDTNTRALWHFNESPGSTTFYDSSDYGNHLTGHNGATTVVFFQNPIFLPLVKH